MEDWGRVLGAVVSKVFRGWCVWAVRMGLHFETTVDADGRAMRGRVARAVGSVVIAGGVVEEVC